MAAGSTRDTAAILEQDLSPTEAISALTTGRFVKFSRFQLCRYAGGKRPMMALIASGRCCHILKQYNFHAAD